MLAAPTSPNRDPRRSRVELRRRPRQHKLSGKHMPKIFRRMHRTMPDQDTVLTLSEEAAAAAASLANDSAREMPAPESDQVAGQIASEAPSVPRATYDQIKAGRTKLPDRWAPLQAEFKNARKRAERDKPATRDYAAVSVVEKFLPV